MTYYQNTKQAIREFMHSSKYSLIAMFENWRKHYDKGGGLVPYLQTYPKHSIVRNMIY